LKEKIDFIYRLISVLFRLKNRAVFINFCIPTKSCNWQIRSLRYLPDMRGTGAADV